MSTATRRFGTDVSNIPPTSLVIPKKSFNSTKSLPVKPQLLQVEIPVLDLPLDDEITIKSPIRQPSPFRYERDFLLALQKYCTQPIEGLLPEVVPGFVHPDTDVCLYQNSRFNKSTTPIRNAYVNTPKHNLSASDESSTLSQYGGVTFRPFTSPTGKSATPYKSNVDRSDLPPVGDNEKIPEFGISSSPVTKLPSSPTSTESSTPSTSPFAANASTLVMNMEWRVKKAKKIKPRETDSRRLAARQKQIDIGMNTAGYLRFCELVPVEQRKREHPKLPDIHQVCSKRSWDGQVRKWRRQLHEYDPESQKGLNGESPAGEFDHENDSENEDEDEESIDQESDEESLEELQGTVRQLVL